MRPIFSALFVQVTMGCDIANPENRIPGWRHFEDAGEVTAVWTEDGKVMFLLKFATGEMLEMHASHTRVVPSAPLPPPPDSGTGK